MNTTTITSSVTTMIQRAFLRLVTPSGSEQKTLLIESEHLGAYPAGDPLVNR